MGRSENIELWLSLIGLKSEAYTLTEKKFIIKGKGFSQHFPIQNLERLATKCQRLHKFEGYRKLVSGFKNPQQFGSTAFEVDSAVFCLDNYSTSNFRLEPEVLVDGKQKYPEFVFETQGAPKIYTECKSLHSLNRMESSRAARLVRIIKPRIENILPANRRAEIAFASLPSHWNRNLEDQIFGALTELVNKDYTRKGINITFDNNSSISVKLCTFNEPFFFKGQIRAADYTAEQKAKILVTESTNFKQSHRNLINDAITQLPPDEPHLIFLKSIDNESCFGAATDFFSSRKRDNLIAIHSWEKEVKIFWNPHAPTSLIEILKKQMDQTQQESPKRVKRKI